MIDATVVEAAARGIASGDHVDTACPGCGPDRRSPANRKKKTLRIWRKPDGFVGYYCARCGERGYASAGKSKVAAPPLLKPVTGDHTDRQAAKAGWLWQRRQPAEGSPVESYLRHRSYRGPIPATLGFLPPSKPERWPAMIACFGSPAEAGPGALDVSACTVRGVHLTLIKPDGSGKAGTERDKLMIGPSAGLPIVLSSTNDLLGLAVCEGIETGLSIYEATGLGVWAAGAAGRMPALADAIPDWIDCVTVVAEADDAGRKGAAELVARLRGRGLHVECLEFEGG